MKAALLAFFGLGIVACVAQEATPASGGRLRQVFTDADKNGDGVITLDESDRPKLFQRLDLDGDGRLTLQEAGLAVQERRNIGAREATAAQPAPPPAATKTSYEQHLDIPYAEIAGADKNLLSLDIYSPVPPTKGGAPVVVMVHGGGWRAGDKATGAVGREKAAFFTSQGYIYVSVNYRLSPAVQHPTHAEDVARSIAWVAKHIKDYGGNPAKISLMGHSAGAHLAALVATDGRYLAAVGESRALLKGVILLDTAGYDIARNMGELSEGRLNQSLYENAFGKDPEVWSAASPISFVKSGNDLPPFLVFYTDRKSSGPLSRDFAAALRKAGVPATAVLAKGKTHATLNHNIGKPDDGPSKLILEFLGGEKSFPDSI
jgi:acetyl esterase/lipase